jgi:hypothetical protein
MKELPNAKKEEEREWEREKTSCSIEVCSCGALGMV